MTIHDFNTKQKEKNITNIIQDLYQMTQSEIKNEYGQPITVEDLQDLFYQDIEQLAELLSIELED